VELLGSREISVYALLKASHILVTEAAARKLSEGLAK